MSAEPPVNGSVAGPGRLVAVRTDGWVDIERQGTAERRFFYVGMRAAGLGPDPRDPSRQVISIVGGIVDPVGEEVDGVVFALSGEGLRLFAADLLAIADRGRRGAGSPSPDEIRTALAELQQREAEYRYAHDHFGGGDLRTGRAWDLMRRAGNRARLILYPDPDKIDG